MLALQIVACAITLLAAWLMGNKHVSGPALNAVAALCFAVLNASAELWICAAFSAAMAAVNVRNFFRWRRHARVLAMIVAIVGLFLVAPPAFAKHHHHVVAPATTPGWFIFQPQGSPSAALATVRHARNHAHNHSRRAVAVHDRLGDTGVSLVETARSQIGNGPIYGRRSLWCARFMNWVLERTGHHGTGSDLAKSFAIFPHTTAHVGAIAIIGRRGGGHVGVVSGMDAVGNPIVISGNHGGRVRESVYSRRRVLAFVEVPQ